MIAAKVFVVKLIKEFKFSTKLTEKDMKMKLAFTGRLASKYLVSIEKRSWIVSFKAFLFYALLLNNLKSFLKIKY